MKNNIERRREQKIRTPEENRELEENEMEKRKENALEEKERPQWTYTNYGREVIKNLNLRPGEIFVDVGCGVGLATMMAGQENVKAIGLDFNKENVKFANNLAKLTELIFLDKETAENFSSIIKKESREEKGNEEFFEKRQKLASKVKKIQELYPKEKEKLKRDLLDWMVDKDLYDLYLDLKWKDPYLDEKLKKTDLPKNVSFLQGDAVRLPLKSNFADKILSADIIYWISGRENQKNVLGEILRIAKNGALLEVFFWGKESDELGNAAKEKNIILEELKRKEVIAEEWPVPIYKAIKLEEK